MTPTIPVLRRDDALGINFTNLALLSITLIGFALRLPLLDRFPFREDEAIYAYWALHTWYEDPLFLTVWPDKPPLFIWLLSGVFQLLGTSTASARWLNIALSTLTIPLVAASTRKLRPQQPIAPIIAAATLSLSPFAISFSATAFTDPMLVFCGMMAICCALYQRPCWAGLWLAAAIMTKQQGLFYAPLVVSILLIERSRLWRDLLYCAVGVLLASLPILYWDSLRWAVAPSPWDLSVRNYGALKVLPPGQWLERAPVWIDLLWYLLASWWAWGCVIGICGYRLLWGTVRLSRLFPLLFFLWSIVFILIHIVTTIQPWDRYLLPLAPMFALLVGYAFGKLGGKYRAIILAALWITLLIPSASRAATGNYPIGGDHGAYTGVEEAIAWINSELSGTSGERAILYHRVLGWHYRYYFYAGIRAGKYDMRWFPHAVYLADNATKAPHRRRFVIEPAWSPVRDLAQHAAFRQLNVEAQAQFGNFTVLELSHKPQPFCDWCFCGFQGWIVGQPAFLDLDQSTN